MFEETFAAEMATRTGSLVEVATESGYVEGILSTVTPDLVLVIEVNSGYGGYGGFGENNKIYIAVDAINFVFFPVTAV